MQFENAYAPISSIVFGMVQESSDGLLAIAPSPILLTVQSFPLIAIKFLIVTSPDASSSLRSVAVAGVLDRRDEKMVKLLQTNDRIGTGH